MKGWNDSAYDAWITKTPYDDEIDIEVFKAEKYDLYTTDYDDIIKFDTEMLKAEKADYCKESYDDREEYLHECMENLIDELNLHLDDHDAMEWFIDTEKDRYEEMEEMRKERLDELKRERESQK